MDRINNVPRTVFVCALLAILTSAAFWPVLRNGFVNYDDPEYVTENPHVQTGLTSANIRWAFTSQHGGNWHPLTSVSHMLDAQLFGLKASWHHAVNLLFHSGNVVLLYLLLQGLTRRVWRSACVAALFAVHPLHVESVAWVAERKDVLSGFFGLLTLVAYAKYASNAEAAGRTKPEIRNSTSFVKSTTEVKKSEANPKGKVRRKTIFYAFALVFFALGLLSKPMLVTLPCVMLLLDYWPLRRVSNVEGRGEEERKSGGASWVRLFVEKVPFLALSVGSCVMTLWAQNRTGALSSLDALPFEFRISNALVSYVRYLEKAIWPTNLAVFYPPPDAWPIGVVLGAAMILITITGLALWFAKRFPQLAVGWFWFLVTLVPVIGLVQVGRQAMADRYSYLPLIGIFIIAVWGLSDLAIRVPRLKEPLAGIAVAAVGFCAVLAWMQVSYWRDTKSLFEHAIAATGKNAVAENNLGVFLFKANDFERAEPHFAEAVRIKRNYPEALVNLGSCRERAGLTNEAIGYYQQAVQVQPTAPAYYNLANVFARQGKLNEAEMNYRSALELKAEFPEALQNYGDLLARQGRVDEAARHYAAALKLKTDLAEVHLSFGALLAGQQKWDQAIAEFDAALRSDPSNANIHFNLGSAYNAKGESGEAAKHFAEACRLRPDDTEARENLGLLLLSQGKPNEAVGCFQEIARLQPNAKAHYELALALDACGQGEKAITEYREAVRLSPTAPLYMNDLAWALATSPDEKMRDNKDAVRLAEDACRLSGGREPRFFGTLDAAYAGAGRFEEAITTANKTRELALAAGQQLIAQKAEERLALYRAGKPYHSPSRTP
jgi:tetratricopeptide (TPR) repeat protein